MLVGWSEPDAPPEADLLLTAIELERAGRFHRPEDKQRYRSARLLARLVVAELNGLAVDAIVIGQTCRWCGAETHGRPEVHDPPGVFVSWSHAGARVVAAATALGAVGVDVESVAAVDRARVPEDAPTWVRKESLLKATGDGLTIPAERADIGPGAAVTELDVGSGYAACVTVLTADEPVVELRRFGLSVPGRARRDARHDV